MATVVRTPSRLRAVNNPNGRTIWFGRGRAVLPPDAREFPTRPANAFQAGQGPCRIQKRTPGGLTPSRSAASGSPPTTTAEQAEGLRRAARRAIRYALDARRAQGAGDAGPGALRRRQAAGSGRGCSDACRPCRLDKTDCRMHAGCTADPVHGQQSAPAGRPIPRTAALDHPRTPARFHPWSTSGRLICPCSPGTVPS